MHLNRESLNSSLGLRPPTITNRRNSQVDTFHRKYTMWLCHHLCDAHSFWTKNCNSCFAVLLNIFRLFCWNFSFHQRFFLPHWHWDKSSIKLSKWCSVHSDMSKESIIDYIGNAIHYLNETSIDLVAQWIFDEFDSLSDHKKVAFQLRLDLVAHWTVNTKPTEEPKRMQTN